MTNFEEQLKLLVELQGLDTQLFRLADELDSIPLRIKEMDDELDSKSANLKQLENDLKMLQVKRKEKEGDLEAKDGAIRKLQSQLNLLKTNKEYNTMKEEIARARADNSLIEDAILQILDQLDVESKKIVKEKEFLKEEENKYAAEKSKLNAEAQKKKTEADALKASRTELAGKVDKKILNTYEKIVENKGGLAVVPVSGDSCQGCFRVLPAQVISEIQMKNRIVVCENCARMLYIEG